MIKLISSLVLIAVMISSAEAMGPPFDETIYERAPYSYAHIPLPDAEANRAISKILSSSTFPEVKANISLALGNIQPDHLTAALFSVFSQLREGVVVTELPDIIRSLGEVAPSRLSSRFVSDINVLRADNMPGEAIRLLVEAVSNSKPGKADKLVSDAEVFYSSRMSAYQRAQTLRAVSRLSEKGIHTAEKLKICLDTTSKFTHVTIPLLLSLSQYPSAQFGARLDRVFSVFLSPSLGENDIVEIVDGFSGVDPKFMTDTKLGFAESVMIECLSGQQMLGFALALLNTTDSHIKNLRKQDAEMLLKRSLSFLILEKTISDEVAEAVGTFIIFGNIWSRFMEMDVNTYKSCVGQIPLIEAVSDLTPFLYSVGFNSRQIERLLKFLSPETPTQQRCNNEKIAFERAFELFPSEIDIFERLRELTAIATIDPTTINRFIREAQMALPSCTTHKERMKLVTLLGSSRPCRVGSAKVVELPNYLFLGFARREGDLDTFLKFYIAFANLYHTANLAGHPTNELSEFEALCSSTLSWGALIVLIHQLPFSCSGLYWHVPFKLEKAFNSTKNCADFCAGMNGNRNHLSRSAGEILKESYAIFDIGNIEYEDVSVVSKVCAGLSDLLHPDGYSNMSKVRISCSLLSHIRSLYALRTGERPPSLSEYDGFAFFYSSGIFAQELFRRARPMISGNIGEELWYSPHFIAAGGFFIASAGIAVRGLILSYNSREYHLRIYDVFIENLLPHISDLAVTLGLYKKGIQMIQGVTPDDLLEQKSFKLQKGIADFKSEKQI